MGNSSLHRTKRATLAEAQNWRCCYCGVRFTSDGNGLSAGNDDAAVTTDHVIPISQGGSRELDNEVAACRRCNNERDCMDAYEFWRYRSGQPMPEADRAAIEAAIDGRVREPWTKRRHYQPDRPGDILSRFPIAHAFEAAMARAAAPSRRRERGRLYRMVGHDVMPGDFSSEKDGKGLAAGPVQSDGPKDGG